jgi:rubrerythrin
MEKSITGSKTEKNLLMAFAGESQAKNRYEFAAKVARDEGYEQIASIFLETAAQEQSHAKQFFRFLEGGMVEITGSYPAGKINSTKENLEAAREGEHEEWSRLYPEFARIAEEEGYIKVATAFKTISVAERGHEERYNKLLENLMGNKVFAKEEKVFWYCRKCGYIHFGYTALKNCPACGHPEAYFEIKPDNY